MAHAAGLGLAREFREVLQRLDVGHACIATAEHIAIDDIALAVVGLGPQVVLFGLAVAQAVAELVRVGELVLDGGREQVALFLLVVAAGQAVPVVAVAAVGGTHHAAAGQAGGRRAGVQVGHAAIGNVVGLQVLPGQRDLGGRAHAEGHRGGNAPALVLGAAAAGNVGVVHHGVQAQAHAFAQHAVGVDGGAPVAVRAQAHVAADEVLVPGLLGHQVDGAARAATACIGRIGALDDFYRFQVEHFARAGRNVAHAVHEGAGLGIHAADEGLVTRGVAAFAVAEGDAGRGPQGFLQAGRAGLLDDFLVDDLHRLGRVHQRGRELGRGGVVGLHGRFGRRRHVHGAQRGAGLRKGRGASKAQGSGKGQLGEVRGGEDLLDFAHVHSDESPRIVIANH